MPIHDVLNSIQNNPNEWESWTKIILREMFKADIPLSLQTMMNMADNSSDSSETNNE